MNNQQSKDNEHMKLGKLIKLDILLQKTPITPSKTVQLTWERNAYELHHMTKIQVHQIKDSEYSTIALTNIK